MIAKHPMQPIVLVDGIARFRANKIVNFLLGFAQGKGIGLNELALMLFDADDWTQFAQLIGYRVSGAGDLSYFDRDVLAEADIAVDELLTNGDEA